MWRLLELFYFGIPRVMYISACSRQDIRAPAHQAKGGPGDETRRRLWLAGGCGDCEGKYSTPVFAENLHLDRNFLIHYSHCLREFSPTRGNRDCTIAGWTPCLSSNPRFKPILPIPDKQGGRLQKLGSTSNLKIQDC